MGQAKLLIAASTHQCRILLLVFASLWVRTFQFLLSDFLLLFGFLKQMRPALLDNMFVHNRIGVAVQWNLDVLVAYRTLWHFVQFCKCDDALVIGKIVVIKAKHFVAHVTSERQEIQLSTVVN